jgi:two-component system, OmpR family, phosphate regulon response regulator OmpR
VSGPRVLIVDDESIVRDVLGRYLEKEGFRVDSAADGEAAIELAARSRPDIVLLDLMLPKVDGLEVFRRIREMADIPVVMITAKGEEVDRVVGLELGADDYLPKPFEPRELLARLRALLRRAKAPAKTRVLRFGRLEIDRDALLIRVDGAERTLTSLQYALLVALAENAGRVLSREALMELVKGQAHEAFDRSIDVHVSRIRAAIEDDPKKPRRLITVRGAGYVFAKQQP